MRFDVHWISREWGNVRESNYSTKNEGDSTLQEEKLPMKAQGIFPLHWNKASLVQRGHMAKPIGNGCGIDVLYINQRLQVKVL